jgi:hypothetical protein
MKNIVFIPFIKRQQEYTSKSSIGKVGRTDGYEFGIDSWRQWCKKNNCELVIMDQLLMPESEMLITWQRWYVLDILVHSGIEYDQVLVVDADSIVHPDCPNFFNLTDRKFSSPLTDGDYEWVSRAINGYSKMFFNKECCIPNYEFFQTGFVIVNKDHKEFLSKCMSWYLQNQQAVIQSYETLLTGSDITLINCLRKEFNIKLNILPREYGVMDLARKNLLYISKQCWWKDDLTNLYNSGWVYQFNAIPQNELGRTRAYFMQRIYNELYK